MISEIVSETEEIYPCKQRGAKGKGKPAIYVDRLQKKTVYSDRSIKWYCKTCGRVTFTIIVKTNPELHRKKESPDWLLEMRRKLKNGEVKFSPQGNHNERRRR